LILDDLKKKLVEYLKAGDSERMGILRYFLAQVQNKEIELRPQKLELTDEVVFKVLKKQIKNHKELIDIYQKSNKPEKVGQETKEMEILKEFAQMFPFDLEEVSNQNPHLK
jgi:uncharacterized protein